MTVAALAGGNPAWTGMSLLRRAITRNLRWLGPSIGLTMMRQLGEVAIPVLIGLTIDRAVATGHVGALVGLIATLAALFTTLALAYRFDARLSMFAIARESHLLGIEVGRKLLDPLGNQTELRVGELLSISTSDARETAYVLDHVSRVAGATVATIACSTLLLRVNPLLGAIVLIEVPIVVAGLQSTAGMIARRVEEQQSEIGRAIALAADLISGHRSLQGIGAQRTAATRYKEASRRSLTASLRASRVQSAYQGAAVSTGALAAMIVAVAATFFALRGSLSLGELITVIGLAGFLIEPFSLLASVPGSVAAARASANRVAHLLNSPSRHEPSAPADPHPTAEPGWLTVQGATHASLSGISLDVRPGEFVAVLTTDPRDTSALIDLLAGRTRGDDAGTVRVGGRRIDEIPLGERHSRLLVEHHNSDLFSGTLGSNLRLRGDIDVSAALEASCAADVAELHPDGLAHPVNERGAGLSGGQRQRWALARALAADPEVLVLHDPTTSVDAVTEQAIADGIRRLRAGSRTTVVFTSSPAILAAADRVVLIVAGRLRGEGTHRSMIGQYAEYRQRVHR